MVIEVAAERIKDEERRKRQLRRLVCGVDDFGAEAVAARFVAIARRIVGASED